MGSVGSSQTCGCFSVFRAAVQNSLFPTISTSKDPYEDIGLLSEDEVYPAGLLTEDEIQRLLNESRGVINSTEESKKL